MVEKCLENSQVFTAILGTGEHYAKKSLELRQLLD